MLSDIFKLLLKLAETRENNREKLYRDFLHPTYQTFETAHKNYLSSFREYREFIKKNDIDTETVNKLIDRVDSDLKFGFSIRRAAIIESEALQHSKRYEFITLITLIRDYFLGPIDGDEEIIKSCNEYENYNVPRARFIVVLYGISVLLEEESEKNLRLKREIVRTIDQVVTHIQRQKAKIHNEYIRAKVALIGK